ncbi:zinc finger CCCH domain-containing protein 14 isoform X2 [Brienomyrus brachyistius]|nr:zinc finger CCCH domain-containing protein 14 isoform X2 [Brienomyrus brachyistius]
MEIGTEISKKIRTAIKGKLQELGAYVDEELPDYIMVMVANKKNAQQMAEDLSLFLGNNTLKFTVWLHGVLEKLRSVAVEPTPLRTQHPSADPSGAGRGRVASIDDRRGEDLRGLGVSSSHPDRTEARVTTSSVHEHHITTGRLTSAVKPLVELLSSEAIIDIKPELDDDLIAEDLPERGTGGGRTTVPAGHGSARPSVELYRPPPAVRPPGAPARTPGRAQESLHGYRPTEQPYSRPHHTSIQDSRGSRSTREDEVSRKRKAPVASSIVRVSRGDGRESEQLEEEDEEDEEDEDEEGYGGRSGGLSSRVSLPSKPERRPTLPPAKQANKNLILKAISEAQASISKTTNYTTAPQRQMVPVAPRTRSAGDELGTPHLQAPEDHLSPAPREQTYVPTEPASGRQEVQMRSLSSRLQMDVSEQGTRGQQAFIVSEAGGVKPSDTRSFIVRRPEVEELGSVQNRLGGLMEDTVPPTPRTVQTSRDRMETPVCASPKFIVTLDGVPSPLADVMESDTDSGERPRASVHQRLQREQPYSEEEDEPEMDVDVPVKRQKVLERCKFWPVCKSGDECLYHHPTTKCKTFPSCKFGDKCLFVHPNCKYDAKCTKTDCPFTHVSRRGPTAPPRPAAQPSSATCRFFPDCKKMDCPFYHPKACRFAAQCKRTGCPYYHPARSVPPRHALKWTKAPIS